MTNTPNYDKFVEQMNEMLLVGAITKDPKVREFNDVMLEYSFKMAESHWNSSHKPNQWYEQVVDDDISTNGFADNNRGDNGVGMRVLGAMVNDAHRMLFENQSK